MEETWYKLWTVRDLLQIRITNLVATFVKCINIFYRKGRWREHRIVSREFLQPIVTDLGKCSFIILEFFLEDVAAFLPNDFVVQRRP